MLKRVNNVTSVKVVCRADGWDLLLINADGKILASNSYRSSDSDELDALQYLLSDVMSIIGPEMKDSDPDVLYVLRAPGVDSKSKKKFTLNSDKSKHKH